MCNWMSAIVLRNGDLLYNLATDSHEDLVALFNLRDKRGDEFCRVEFSPKKPEDVDKPDEYALKVDEKRTPDWFDERIKEKTATAMRSVVLRCIVNGPVTCLIGGCYILTKGASVEFTKATRIVAMCDTSQVGAMRGTSKVGAMRGTSQVGAMCDTSKVGVMCDTSQVGVMWDNSKVGEMWDTSKVPAGKEPNQ